MSEFALDNALELRVKIDKQRKEFQWAVMVLFVIAFVTSWFGEWSASSRTVLFAVCGFGLLLRHEIRQHLRQMELRLMLQISPDLETQLLDRYNEVKSDRSAWKLWGTQ